MSAVPSPRYLEVPGGRIAYDLAGPPHAPAVVLIHQAIADRRVWDRQVAALAPSYRVVRYDLRGFGGSTPAEKAFSHVEDLGALLEHLKLDRPLVVGASMGGRIALDYAVAHPGAVRGLLLLAPGFSGMDYPMFPDAGPAFAEDERISKAAQDAYAAGKLDEAIEHLRRLWAAALTGADLEQFRAMVRENAPEAFLDRSGQHERPVEPKAASRLATLDVPLVVLVGDRDNPAMPHVARYLTQQVPRARLRSVPGADHMLNLGSPLEVDRAIEEMLGGASR
jgi:3-oxoadipate enol-lactonase